MNDSRRKPFAKKSLGQNFLTDPNYIRKIVDAVDPKAGETVVEIGPGRGALTEKLVDTEALIVAIELDSDLVQHLREKFAERRNLVFVENDVLQSDFSAILTSVRASLPAKLVANLPYYISTAILQRLSEQRDMFSELVLMFQKEVVDRITALPGNSERGFLTVIVESCFHVEKLFDVPPSAFRPMPKVWSSVVRLRPKETEFENFTEFRQIVSIGFAQKRKTLLNNLKPHVPVIASKLEIAEIDPKRRAESLTLEEWIRIFRVLE